MNRRSIFALALLAAGIAAAQGPDNAQSPTGALPDYSQYTHLRTTPVEKGAQLLVVYANEQAASITAPERRPYPHGSVFVAEWRHAVAGANGQPAPGALIQVDMMRRGPGFGAVYGESRAGEWQFARYRADGAPLVAEDRAEACAACHRNAGAERDFVFAGRFPAPAATRMGGE
jgi:hypothetical protein